MTDGAEPLSLRPHHLLCIRFWQGKGYSAEFTAAMERVVAFLPQNPGVRLVRGLDRLCAACPHNSGSACESEAKVRRYDDAVLSAAALSPGSVVPWETLHARVTERIMEKNLFNRICGDCTWASLCHGSASSGGA